MSIQVATITIGQSPRKDMVPELVAGFPSHVEITEFGVLDDISSQELSGIASKTGESCLVSKLRDGTEVLMSHSKVVSRLAILLHRIDDMEYNLIVVLCTGTAPMVSLNTPCIWAMLLLDNAISDLEQDSCNVGVIVPDFQQIPASTQHHYTSASPYTNTSNALKQAANELSDCKNIFMKCMGYSEAMRTEVQSLTNAKVLTPRVLVSKAVSEFVQAESAGSKVI